MYLFDFLFTLQPDIYVRIKFIGEPNTYCFRTGRRSTGKAVSDLSKQKKDNVKVHNVYCLWHAQELYIECS